jgi:hypothetical protein
MRIDDAWHQRLVARVYALACFAPGLADGRNASAVYCDIDALRRRSRTVVDGGILDDEFVHDSSGRRDFEWARLYR